LDAVGLVLQALVDFDEGNNLPIMQRLRSRFAVDLAIHRALEQDRADHFVAVESG
jgi:hypothetical protein